MTERSARQRVSVAEARMNLPALIREAEGGRDIEITRRGKPVAVLLSTAIYRRLAAGRAPLGKALDALLDEVDVERVGLERDDLRHLRDRGPGREAPR